jgi:protein required for attachment to host cells
MQLPHNAAVLVADGRKLLFLRNEGDDTYPNLVVEQAEEHLNPADHDQKSDSPGRASSASVGSGQAVLDEPDYHQIEEDCFAAEAAELQEARTGERVLGADRHRAAQDAGRIAQTLSQRGQRPLRRRIAQGPYRSPDFRDRGGDQGGLSRPDRVRLRRPRAC